MADFSKGSISRARRSSDSQVLYYPGEATLGLISLYEIDHSKQWLTAAGVGIFASCTKPREFKGLSSRSLGRDRNGEVPALLRSKRRPCDEG